MSTEGFTATNPVTIWHRLALVDMEIVWDSDGTDDVILGILPVLRQFVTDQIDHATSDAATWLRIIAADHPRLSKGCLSMADRLNRIGG